MYQLCSSLKFHKIRPFLPVILLMLAIPAAFAPSLCYDFLYSLDDALYVNNFRFFKPSLEAWQEIWCGKGVLDLYTPLAQSSYWLDAMIWGTNSPVPFRAVNILWHTAAAAGFYFLQRELNVTRSVAALLAFAFAISPLRVESVVWISERKDVICCACYIWGLWAALKNRMPLMLVLFSMAMLAKPMAVSFPAAVWLLIFFQRGKAEWKQTLYAAGVALIYFIWRGDLVKDAAGAGTWHIKLALENLLYYAFSSVFPFFPAPLQNSIDMDIRLLIAIYILLAIAGGLVFYFRRECFLKNILPMAIAFGAVIFPVSGFFSFGSAPRADRYTYIASIFPLLLAGKILPPAKEVKLILAGYAGVLLISFELYLPVFQNEYTLFSTAVSAAGEKVNYRALGTLADLTWRQGDFDGALNLLNHPACRGKKDIEIRQRLFSSLNDGNIHELENLIATEQDYLFLESINREYPVICVSALANATENIEQREKYYRKAGKWSTDGFVRCFFLGLAEFDARNYRKAKQYFARALEFAPESNEARMNMIKAEQLEQEK